MAGPKQSGLSTTTLYLIATVVFLVGCALTFFTGTEHPEGWTALQVALLHVAKEIGFALIVAAVVWMVFEQLAARHEQAIWNARIESISENVFYGVLRRQIPAGVLHVANRLALTQSLLRKNFRYDIRLLDPEEGGSAEYLELRVKARYQLSNVSDIVAKHSLKGHLPEPTSKGPRGKVKFHHVEVRLRKGASDGTPAELVDKANASLKPDGNRIAFDIGEFAVEPEDTLSCELEYSLIKSSEDTDLIRTHLPAEALTVSIKDETKKQFLIQALSIHDRDVISAKNDVEQGSYEYQINDYLLPHQGMLLWWKPRK
ncbi:MULTISPECIES: hypothetical protein [Bradyrhizobium]|uniref:Uncharacterized protein n=1 Tax=Bradyrhizobium arachidis TaxID=858423 RepID=A0AAE7NWG4_9BRAD|nr:MULTISPECIES: hypothetical protein [Bradyrhizobium]QOG16951.1 hypothetical protein FOM02_05965 [Bradyrhizobium sp. SEMIA]QOZ71465.1 hypothetical protein WN72_38125 [Bradyrhizobium arachidis]UFW47781.1 hypothetical protein BaraCB756_36835 [Bradyrhizobium arachidis]SFU51772.1 hypothetical protein SAMN05192541_102409 [Bradyrhizobium arachidis]